jgi:hypothetical protein
MNLDIASKQKAEPDNETAENNADKVPEDRKTDGVVPVDSGQGSVQG